jgi:hypothetical protein
MLNIEKTEELPAVRRGGGRPSAERKQIQEALNTLETQVVRDVEAGNKYNALQQRIRQTASAMGLKVKIVYRKHEDNEVLGDLYFVGMNEIEDPTLDAKKSTVRRNTTTKATA